MSYLPITLPRTNLYCWLDATGLVDNTTNAYGICSGGTCSQWSDLSGNSRHFTQGTGANQPTLGTGLSSLPALTFDGGDNLNNTTDADWVFLHSGAATILLVAKCGTVADPNTVYALMGSGSTSTSNIGILMRYADRAASSESDGFEFNIFQGGGVQAVNSTTYWRESILPNQYQLIALRYDCTVGSSGSMLSFLTYRGGGSVASSAAPSGSNATYDMQIGAGGNNSNRLVGGIQEIAIYNEICDIGKYGKAIAYFQKKYAL